MAPSGSIASSLLHSPIKPAFRMDIHEGGRRHLTPVKVLRKRRRIVRILVLPVALLIGILGWTLIWIGSAQKPKKNQKTQQPATWTALVLEVPLQEQKV